MALRVVNIDHFKGKLLLYTFVHTLRLMSYHNDDHKSALKLLEITEESGETEIRKASQNLPSRLAFGFRRSQTVCKGSDQPIITIFT